MKKPYISVIVTAYNRKEYLLDALKSIVNQSLDREQYEIICIKNFYDKEIDSYIKENNISNLFKDDVNIGEYLYIATKVSKGDVLVFLDDDDIFQKEKLKRVYEVFNNYNIGFYHNERLEGQKPMFESNELDKNSYKILKPTLFNLNCLSDSAVNMSSIAIKKDIMSKHVEELRVILTSPDSFCLILNLIEIRDVFSDKNKMTFYRIHESNTSLVTNKNGMKKHILFLNNLEIPALEYQLSLSKRYKASTAITLSKDILFLVKSYSDIIQKKPRLKILKDIFEHLSLISILIKKRYAKRILICLIYIIDKKILIKLFLIKLLNKYSE